ncbi:MAG TPA: hypothetical protein VHE83_03590 [Mycobacteriales bacterium]|nr:hypothetical protein [Mycobacteriales bacterium]
MSRRLLLAFAAVPAFVACGTTVPGADYTGVRTGGPAAAIGAGGVPAPVGATTTAAGSGPIGAALPTQATAGVLPGLGPAPSATGGAGTLAKPSSLPAGPTTGPSAARRPTTSAPLPVGVTATAINVGFTYDPGANQALAAVGGAALAGADVKQMFQAVIDDINAHGGIVGKQISPVVDTVSDNGQSQAQADDEACSYFTQDHRTYAVFILPGDEEGRRCLERNGATALVNETLSTTTEGDFARHPSYVEPGTLAYDRALVTLSGSLARQGWYGGWNTRTGSSMPGGAPVLGVVYEDDGAEGGSMKSAVTSRLLPALAAAGHPVDPANVVSVTAINSSADYSAFTTQASTAALKLASNGVTHVILADHAGGLMEFMVAAADKQGYFPRYGFTTQAGPQANLDAGLVSAKDLAGSMGIGWFPNLDLPAAANPPNGPYSTAATKHCLAVLAAKGITFANANASSQGLGVCDDLYTLKQVLEAGGPELTTASWSRGIAALGNRLTSAVSLAQTIAPDHRDTADGVRDYDFDASCRCMAYVGSTYAPAS